MTEFQPSIRSPHLVLFPVLMGISALIKGALQDTPPPPRPARMLLYLVKSVFRAPVPAYCTAHALALSAHASWSTQTTVRAHSHQHVTCLQHTEDITIPVDLLKLGLLFNPLTHIENAHPLWAHRHTMNERVLYSGSLVV